MTDLARRATACKHWRWLPGMLVSGRYKDAGAVIGGPNRFTIRLDCDGWGAQSDALGKESHYVVHEGRFRDGEEVEDVAPVLEDKSGATIGCLLALVRAAWGDDRITPRWVEPETTGGAGCWVVHAGGFVFRGDTEAAALVAALEAAP